jgi:hypothetical protein
MYVAENSLLTSHSLNVSRLMGTAIALLGTEMLNLALFNDKECGLFVQSGKTSPSRGEDHRFKSGTAHSQIWYYVGFSSVVGLRFCRRSFCI